LLVLSVQLVAAAMTAHKPLTSRKTHPPIVSASQVTAARSCGTLGNAVEIRSTASQGKRPNWNLRFVVLVPEELPWQLALLFDATSRRVISERLLDTTEWQSGGSAPKCFSGSLPLSH
jgi:hypothetical protein